METIKTSHTVKVAFNPVYGWVVFLDTFKLDSSPDRFYFIMDKTGNHELLHESQIYSFEFYSRVTCKDSRDLLILLKELSIMTNLKSQILSIIETFKIIYCNG